MDDLRSRFQKLKGYHKKIVTPDGRYWISPSKGILRRTPNPNLDDVAMLVLEERVFLARKNIIGWKKEGRNISGLLTDLKQAETELIGNIWWTDGTPDLSGKSVHDTHYKSWYLARKH